MDTGIKVGIFGTFGWAQVLAGLALIVSIMNAYFTFFRRGTLRVHLGDVLMLQMNEKDMIYLYPEVSIHNPGSTLAVITHAKFELINRANDLGETLVWKENVTTVFKDEGRMRDTRFESFPGILFVEGGQAVIKRLALFTTRPYKLVAGDYYLQVTISSDGTLWNTVKRNSGIRLTQEDIDFLINTKLCAENEKRRILPFVYQRGENTNCFLRASYS